MEMKPLARLWISAAFLALGCPNAALAQGTREDYQRAEQFLAGNLRHRVYLAEVTAHWIAKQNRFWYRKAGMKGAEFLLVDADQNSVGPAFDHAKIASSLSQGLKREVQANELPFEAIEFSDDGKSISFQVEGTPWSCTRETSDCKRGPEPVAGPYEEASPNKEWVAYVKDHDLYVRYVSTGQVVRLTRDGEASYDYATEIPSLRPMIAQGTQEIKQRPAVFWSPDSSKLVTYRMDTRNAGRFTNLQFVPPGQLRPKAFTVVYPLPGEVLPTAEPMVFELQGGKRIDVKTAPIEMQFQGGPAFDWYPDSKTFSYKADERGQKSIELREVAASTGEQRVVVHEKAERYVDPGETHFRILREAGDVLWTSERDGWNHLYLSNLKTGELRPQLTQGPWVVRQIVDVDEKARRIYFLGSGRERDEDAYLTHLYGVGVDGKGLTLLTPENANHTVTLSPDYAYFVDNFSRPDLPAVSLLKRTKDGSVLRRLEQTDTSELTKIGWKVPEPFRGKAKDGVTDLYGLIWKPTNFDPGKKYPIVEMVYTGPQAFFVPKTFGAALRNPDQQIAELGFIGVMIDGRGTTGRSRAFHEFSYHNLGGAFEDHVEMIKQMAREFPYMDADRIGIFGTSAGGYGAAHAMLLFPDFYKVCVSISGDHDARLDKAWWNELYQGYPLGPDYLEQSNVTLASRLQGHLLVEHGDIDENVHVVETMRFADALIKANKNFDMLIVPNMYHGEGGNPYLIRRRWDYFVQYLLGVTPPADFAIHEDRENAAPRTR